MPHIYVPDDDDSSSIKSKGSSSDDVKLVGTLNASQVIEDSNRRFITDREREILYLSLTKNIYDKDNDGVIDHALNSDTAESANSAQTAEHSSTSDYATQAASATTSEHADTATTAESSTKSETATVAESVEWDNILNKPETYTPSEHQHSIDDITLTDLKTTVSTEQINTWDNKQDKLDFTPEDQSKKGTANGYAPLNGDCKVPDENLPNVQWDSILNKPSSTIDQIDQSVEKSHSHVNISVLDIIDSNNDNKPTWDGKEWPYPGDMKKSIYDKDDDGIVDVAKSANSVYWNGISEKPTSSVSDIDLAVSRSHSHNNLQSLNLLNVDNSGNPIWNGEKWPYDMKKSDYDADSDGIVDVSKTTESVEWNNVLNKPSSTTEEIDNSVYYTHEHQNKSVLDYITYDDSTEHILYRGRELGYTSDSRIFVVEDASKIETKQSIIIDIDGKIHLVNDSTFIDPLSYYGTDKNGSLGWKSLNDVFDIYKPEVGKFLTYEEETDILELVGKDSASVNKFYSVDEEGTPGFYSLTPSSIELDDEHKFISTSDLDDLHRVVEVIDGGGGGGKEVVVNNYNYYYDISYDTRQTILSAMPNFFTLDGSDLIIKASEDYPLVMTFSKDSDEVIRKITSSEIMSNVPSIIKDGDAYIYVSTTLEDESVSFNRTPLAPIYSPTQPTEISAGQYWFNTKEYVMYVSDGNKYNKSEELVLFIGYIISSNGSVMYNNYAINGMYDSGWYNVDYSTTYSKNHNIGSELVTYNAFIGYNDTNYGEFSFALQGSSITDLHPVGDRVSLITKNSIQTTRYFNIPYSPQAANAVYGPTNQHRVIVRRAW